METPPLLTQMNVNMNYDYLDRSLSADSISDAFATRSELRADSSAPESPKQDHTISSWSIVSYVVACLLVIVVPIFKLLFVKASPDISRRQIAFQPVVAFVEVFRSTVSFVFLSQAFGKHGLQALLFRLGSVADEVAQRWTGYDTVVQHGGSSLRRFIQVFVPSFVLYLCQLLWLYFEWGLKPMPFTTHHPLLEVGFALFITTLSWMFQTTAYLYACVLFWKVCELQELKMRAYLVTINRGEFETEYSVIEYERIKTHLRGTSHRFRAFLAFTGVISVLSALITMYEALHSINDWGLSLCLWGDLFVLSVVNLTGAWQCLHSASKIASLHRRIRWRAASIHASLQIRTRALADRPEVPPDPYRPHYPKQRKSSKGKGREPTRLETLEGHYREYEAWARRAVVVEYLSDEDVGISFYGLDTLFAHTCIGAALLATPWFILVRSLQG